MQTYISILRGINVGGQRMIKMGLLKTLYEDLGCTEVQTYIQSGNVVFQHEQSPPEDLEIKITGNIVSKFGFEVPVIVLKYTELKQIIEGNPFIDENNTDLSPYHVTFLRDAPGTHGWEAIRNQILQSEDQCELINKSIYLYCPHGYGRTKLTNGFFEQKLGTMATTRNWKTTIELLRMAEETMTNKNT